MNIPEIFKMDTNKKQLVSIVGAGGKTTLLYELSVELKKYNKKVLLSTTTNIFTPPKEVYDDIFIDDHISALREYVSSINNNGVYVIGHKHTEENKIKGIDVFLADELYASDIFDFILIEADGSKRKPIKAPADWEPVVPKNTTMCIGVIGLDSLGKTAKEDNVHRLKEFCSICKCAYGDEISETMLVRLISHPYGLFKNSPVDAKKFALLNKADKIDLAETGFRIKKMMEDKDIKCVIASLKNHIYWM